MASRNRPRTSVGSEDNTDISQLWASIVERIKACDSVHSELMDVEKSIEAAKSKLNEEDFEEILDSLSELETLNRTGVKLAEDELRALNEEPDDIIKSLETLIAVRAVFEEAAPKVVIKMKETRQQRRSDTGLTADSPSTPTGDGTAAAASKPLGKGARGIANAVAAKAETPIETIESGKAAGERSNQLTIGSEVYLRNKSIAGGGEGILCKITNIFGDGSKRKYEIKDSADLDEGKETTPHKVTAALLVPIMPTGTRLPEFAKGKQVVALYPDSTVFYKAEFVGTSRKDRCKLRFEEETDDKEVERRYVLEAK